MALPAQAAYPDKPVRYIIAFAPGGESDIVARFQQQVWRKKFAQELIVESKPGAGGALAWSQLNGYPGDGYTIMGTNLPHLVLQPLEGNVQYKTEDITNDQLLQLHARRHRRAHRVALQDLPGTRRTRRRRRPGKLNLAGSGTNSANHAAHARLDNAAGHRRPPTCPFKGTGDLIASLLGGHVDGAMSYSSLALAQKGKTRAARGGHAGSAFRTFPTCPRSASWASTGWTAPIAASAFPSRRRRTCAGSISDIFADIGRDPEFRRKMIEQGTRDHRRHLRQDGGLHGRAEARPISPRRSCWGS